MKFLLAFALLTPIDDFSVVELSKAEIKYLEDARADYERAKLALIAREKDIRRKYGDTTVKFDPGIVMGCFSSSTIVEIKGKYALKTSKGVYICGN